MSTEAETAMQQVLAEDRRRREVTWAALVEALTRRLGWKPSDQYVGNVYYHLPMFMDPDRELDVEDFPLPV